MRIEKLILHEIACFEHVELNIKQGQDPNKADIHMLVGPNGCGKSSILAALAQFFSWQDTGLKKRCRCLGSKAVLLQDNELRAIVFQPKNRSQPTIIENDKQLISYGSRFIGGLYEYKEEQTRDIRFDYIENSRTWRPNDLAFSNTRFNFAAFAYSGARSVQSFALGSIQRESGSPFEEACTFISHSSTERMIQWLANTKTKEAHARNQGDSAKAENWHSAIARIEKAIKDITEHTFEFVFEYETLNVLARLDGEKIPLDVLPDGLKSILSWIADLLMRMDRIPWENELPILEREFLLLLDEIEVHLHPAWQRKILPVVQSLFPKAQVFISTHSPFVVASADDAWIYPFELNVQTGKSTLRGEPLPSQVGNSYTTVLRDVLGIEAEFDFETNNKLDAFYKLRDKVLRSECPFIDLKMSALELSKRSVEIQDIVNMELRQVQYRLSRASGAASS